MAFYKGEDAAKSTLPLNGAVLFTICARDRNAKTARAAGRLAAQGFKLLATDGTQKFLAQHGIAAERILKLHEGRPNILDALANGQIQLIVNTPAGKFGATDDSYIRKAAIRQKIPYITTVAAALAAADGIEARLKGGWDVRSLQDYHAAIKPVGRAKTT
jgi:carbamoyl-phosphate synthase large subunit